MFFAHWKNLYLKKNPPLSPTLTRNWTKFIFPRKLKTFLSFILATTALRFLTSFQFNLDLIVTIYLLFPTDFYFVSWSVHGEVNKNSKKLMLIVTILNMHLFFSFFPSSCYITSWKTYTCLFSRSSSQPVLKNSLHAVFERFNTIVTIFSYL